LVSASLKSISAYPLPMYSCMVEHTLFRQSLFSLALALHSLWLSLSINTCTIQSEVSVSRLQNRFQKLRLKSRSSLRLLCLLRLADRSTTSRQLCLRSPPSIFSLEKFPQSSACHSWVCVNNATDLKLLADISLDRM